ncbi:hypothetical protein GGC47_000825 [Bosea sp. OAE752]|uniref:hypothetical protein n=2 Tax=unclassified Bosea (in: a-proteobacteria) TaxID=2653178 RepID=UPI00114FBBF1
MTILSGPVGVRDGVTQVANAPVDQQKIIRLLWGIDPGSAGMKGVSPPPPAGAFKRCNPTLAAAILAFQTFWVERGELNLADGVVDPGGRSLRKLDALAAAGPPAPTPPKPDQPGFIDLKVLRFQQTLPTVPGSFSIPAIVPSSVMPFLFAPVARDAALVEGSAEGTISEFLFKIEKNGAIFWVGACIPAGTIDFSRAYIYFHPDTISASDDAGYPTFTGRWPTVKRYVAGQGLQMAAMKTMPLIVPFMTNASRSNQPRTNLFADRGVETLDDILAAIQITLGQTTPRGSVQQVGTSSFSSGVNHLARFAEMLGGSGLIREQIDFDSAFMRNAHKLAPSLPGAVNWMVTQSPPPWGKRIGWLYLPQSAFRNVHTMRGDTHSQIGTMMFQTMMMLSVIP